jgi:hypothetical protein
MVFVLKEYVTVSQDMKDQIAAKRLVIMIALIMDIVIKIPNVSVNLVGRDQIVA